MFAFTQNLPTTTKIFNYFLKNGNMVVIVVFK